MLIGFSMKKFENTKWIWIVMGMLIALPITVGLFAVASGHIKSLIQNIGDILPFLVVALLFGMLTFITRVFESKDTKIFSRYLASISDYPEDWPEIRLQAIEDNGYQCGGCGVPVNLKVH
jgi:hypothetical protein